MFLVWGVICSQDKMENVSFRAIWYLLLLLAAAAAGCWLLLAAAASAAAADTK